MHHMIKHLIGTGGGAVVLSVPVVRAAQTHAILNMGIFARMCVVGIRSHVPKLNRHIKLGSATLVDIAVSIEPVLQRNPQNYLYVP